MPEGPEIKRVADRVGKAVIGQPLAEVWFGVEALKPFELILAQQTVIAVDSRGKGMLTRFSGGLSVYTHSKLFGHWFITRAGSYPKNNRMLRFALKGERIWALLYSTMHIEVLDPDAESAHPYLSKLGPDILAPDTTPEIVANRFLEPQFARQKLALLLLDQKCLCGPGNYLRSEVLWAARIRPERAPGDLAPAEIASLGIAVHDLSQRAYVQRGFTIDTERAREMEVRNADDRDRRHYVFERNERPCPRCSDPIAVSRLAGRRIFWCPVCQV